MPFISGVIHSPLVLKELCPMEYGLGISLMCSTCKFLVHYVGHISLSKFKKENWNLEL